MHIKLKDIKCKQRFSYGLYLKENGDYFVVTRTLIDEVSLIKEVVLKYTRTIEKIYLADRMLNEFNRPQLFYEINYEALLFSV